MNLSKKQKGNYICRLHTHDYGDKGEGINWEIGGARLKHLPAMWETWV